jgi:hypothetical protein
MARKCTICAHKDRNKIDLALVDPNETLRTISDRFGVSKSSLKRHKESGHIAKKAARSETAKDERETRSFFDEIADHKNKADTLYNMALDSEDIRGACAALRESRGAIELRAKATGELTEKHEITGKDGGPVKTETALNIAEEVKKIVGILPSVKL